MNEVIKNIETRRSVRKYSDKLVSKEDLTTIMKAGTFAPSGRSAQSPIMVCIQNPDTIAKIAKLNAAVINSDSNPFYGAPTLIVVFAKIERTTNIQDGSAAITTMLNAAHSIGIDTCWIHRAKETFETEEGKAMMKKWGVSDEYTGIGNVILGFCDGEYPVAKSRNEGRIIWAD